MAVLGLGRNRDIATSFSPRGNGETPDFVVVVVVLFFGARSAIEFVPGPSSLSALVSSLGRIILFGRRHKRIIGRLARWFLDDVFAVAVVVVVVRRRVSR